MSNYCVITTINKPTKAVEKLYEHFGENFIVVGDAKTPSDWAYKKSLFISIKSKIEFSLSAHIRPNHYSIKNIGYLTAIMNNAASIYDTDDDNIPNNNFFIRNENVIADKSITTGWFNVYDVFCGEHIWPRGFSLRHIKNNAYCGEQYDGASSIQQGMADGDPDVDAIWRLVFVNGIKFNKRQSVYLKQKSWCPFNSQSTWFFPKAYPLMYLPVRAPFRMTDIWRSFIGQRCLWEIGEGVTFHSPAEVFQDRNEHDLLKDFEDEWDGYIRNEKIVDVLSKVNLKPGVQNICDNLLCCYDTLISKDIFPSSEINSVKAWVKDYENVTANMG